MIATINLILKDNNEAQKYWALTASQMLQEHAWYYARSIDPDKPGATIKLDEKSCLWRTSGGNVMKVYFDDNKITIFVDGVRHGIPWQFLQLPVGWKKNATITNLSSQIDDLPWIATGPQGGDMAPDGLSDFDFDEFYLNSLEDLNKYEICDSDPYKELQKISTFILP